MQRPPDYLTTEEQKALDKIVELDIDFWVESKNVHEVVKDEETENCDD